MVKKHKDSSQEPLPRDNFERTSSRRDVEANQELKARRIVSAMTDAGRIQDLRNRRQLAENLGRILSHRKNKLNLSELVVAAGISENPDPARLGRFRILPGKTINQPAIKRLSQDALAYVRLVKEVAKISRENQSTLLEELVLGTRFDPSGLENVGIEPFEQLFALIQKKIEALDAKFDLAGYFHALKTQHLLPLWSDGPICSGQRISRHNGERPQIVGWEKQSNISLHSEERYQVMPCVPLCRIRRTEKDANGIDIPKPPISATIQIGKFRDENAELYCCWRLFLAVGMFDHEVWEYWNETGDTAKTFFEVTTSKGSINHQLSPQPYLVGVQEFHYEPMSFFFPKDTDEPTGIQTVTGGVDYDQNPFFFYDETTEFTIESIEDHYRMEPSPGMEESRFGMAGCLFMLEQVHTLGLSSFREVFGRTGRCETLNGDSLKSHEMGMTLAPHGTIAELMETNILSRSFKEGGSNSETGPTFLDLLEEDTERLTSSLHKWLEASRSDLNHKHHVLLERFGRECEEAKSSPKKFRPED